MELTRTLFVDDESYALAQQHPKVMEAVKRGFETLNKTPFKAMCDCVIFPPTLDSDVMRVRFYLSCAYPSYRRLNRMRAYRNLLIRFLYEADSDVVLE